MRRLLAVAVLLVSYICAGAQQKQSLHWQLSCSDSADGPQSGRMEAKVPGCVQFDWGRANNLPSYHEGDNQDKYYGLEDKWWHYFATVDIKRGRVVPYLCFEGVDYKYDVLVDGILLLSHEGMFSRPRIDLSAYKGKTVAIEVLIHPAPKNPDIEPYRGLGNESSKSCKPAFSYGWDWAPRFITLGLVDEVYVEYRPASHVRSWDMSYVLDSDNSKAAITIDYSVAGKTALRAELLSPEGKVVATASRDAAGEGAMRLNLDSPELWWPWNHGAQPVYSLRLTSAMGEILSRKISFRRSEMVYNEGGRHDGAEVTVPACIQINGRQIFAKGSNWVPSEMCRSEVNKQNIRTLFTYLKGCNMNILRLWGGSYVQPDWFYDMCDEMGIMLWQEFPLACARYSEEQPYLDVLAQESESMIKQLRTHASVVMYCGGNELFFKWFEKWGGMSYQSKPLRLLDSQMYKFDPDTPYWFASPQPGIRHGGYFPIEGGEEIVTMFYDSRYFGYTEFGCGTISEMDVIKSVVSEEDFRHPFVTPIWKARHANQWGDLRVTGRITGKDYSNNFEQGVKDANDVQGDCYRELFELARQKWPYTSMALNWCFNEPWVTLAGNGLVNYPDHIRPAYYLVREALRPTLLSLSFRQLSWKAGDEVRLDAFLLNDSGASIAPCSALLEVIADGKVIAKWDVSLPRAEAWRNSKCADCFCFSIPKTTNGRVRMKITSPEHPEWDSEYSLYVK